MDSKFIYPVIVTWIILKAAAKYCPSHIVNLLKIALWWQTQVTLIIKIYKTYMLLLSKAFVCGNVI